MLKRTLKLFFIIPFSFSTIYGCKTSTGANSAVNSKPGTPLPRDQDAVLDAGATEEINYALDNEALWKSPSSHFTEACAAEAQVWNRIIESEYPKKGEYYDGAQLPPPQSRWDTVLGILKKPHTSIPTFIKPHQNGNRRYSGEEIPDKETFAKAIAFMKEVGSLGVLSGTKSGRTRDKVIHASGSVAKIAFVPNASVVDAPDFPYTGMVKYGAPCGFIRAGLAVSNANHPFTPGVGFKFFINKYPDGNPAKTYSKDDENPESTNVLAMYSLDGQDSNNFFANPISNILPFPTRTEMKLGAQYFAASLIAMGARPGTEESDPTILSVEEMGTFFANGQRQVKGQAPYRLTFKPTEDAQKLYASGGETADVRQILLRFPVGTTIYEVFATDDKTPQGDPGLHVGSIVLKTSFRASLYGDEKLHFRHVKQMKKQRFK